MKNDQNMPSETVSEEITCEDDASEESPSQEVQELKERNETLLRALANSENRQKIVAREKDIAVRYAQADFVKKLLDVVDALESAVQSCDFNTLTGEAKTLSDGVLLTRSLLKKVFTESNIEIVEPNAGDAFDHGRHQAVAQEKSDLPKGVITKLLRQGFLLQDRLLRPAFVSVSSGEATANEKDESAD